MLGKKAALIQKGSWIARSSRTSPPYNALNARRSGSGGMACATLGLATYNAIFAVHAALGSASLARTAKYRSTSLAKFSKSLIRERIFLTLMSPRGISPFNHSVRILLSKGVKMYVLIMCTLKWLLQRNL